MNAIQLSDIDNSTSKFEHYIVILNSGEKIKQNMFLTEEKILRFILKDNRNFIRNLKLKILLEQTMKIEKDGLS